MRLNWKWIICGLTLIWLIAAPGCMRLRIADEKALQEFGKAQVRVSFKNLKVNKRTIHYVITGSDTATTLVFIHGSPGSWDAFKRYLLDSALLKHFRMISIDRPGFGYSDFGNAMGLAEQVPLLFAAIENEKNGKPVHLVGHSIGGPVVIKMIQDFPTWFSSATILAGSISYQNEPKEYWRYPFRYFPLRYIMPGALRPSNDEIIWFKSELKELDKGYHKIHIPVAFIHGDKDGFVSVQNAYYGKSKLAANPSTTITIISGANHFIPWTYFDLIKSKLLELK